MPRTSTTDRAKRRRRLVELLEGGLQATQEEIVERLGREGFSATQATISRDLEDIGAVRAYDDGRATYSLPERNGPTSGFGKRVFAELVKNVASSGNLVVVRTFPGMAPTVAAVLDQSGISGVLGTIAGDDTVLVVADERASGKRVASRIKALGDGQ